MQTKIFQGKKITIRKLSPKDIKTPEKFQEYINSFIEEDAMLLIKTKKTRKDEVEWLKDVLKKMFQKKAVYLVAEIEKDMSPKNWTHPLINF